MPPTIGAAMGFMTSDPMPDSQSIGARLTITAVGHSYLYRMKNDGTQEEKITSDPIAGDTTTLYSFTGVAGGSEPLAGVIRDSSGNRIKRLVGDTN